MYAASAFAANTMVRSAVAASFPLFTTAMFNKVSRHSSSIRSLFLKADPRLQLGINWASTLIGLIALLLMPSPFLFYKYGPWLRSRSTYSPCMVSPCSKYDVLYPSMLIHPPTGLEDS